MAPNGMVRVADVVGCLAALEETLRERAEMMGYNSESLYTRAKADGVAYAIDVLRERYEEWF